MRIEQWLGKDNQLGIDIWKKKYQQNNESFDERINRINDVTKSDVNKLIRKYLKMEEMSKGIIGPMNLNI